MTAKEILEIIEKECLVPQPTCDTVKAGNTDKDVKKVAVSMFATVDIIRQVSVWKADLLIVHEPTYYHHYEEDTDSRIAQEKRKIIEDCGLVIYRYHDRPHAVTRPMDLIAEGGIRALGLQGKSERLDYIATSRFICDSPVTARQLAEKMKYDMGLSFVRIAGETDYPTTSLALCFGTPGHMDDIVEDETVDIILTGETCEWGTAERVRDAVAMGKHKSLIVMTHIGSERDGMKLFAERFAKQFPGITTEYFECGEVYQTI